MAQIVTFGTLKTKAAIRDVGRVLGMPYSAVDAVAKLVPNAFNITVEEAVNKSPELKKAVEENENVARLIDIAKKVEGMPRNTSTHAAGVVITHDPVSSYVPLATNDGLVVTQYIMTTLEELGLLKMDFLGLRTLTVINDAAKASGVDIDSISIDDKKVYSLFARGKTEGVFQFESNGMKQMLMNLQPKALEDLIAATSLYRPGPASQIDTFVENSKNQNKIKYETPLLEPILKNTYGCIVYQEQVMQIFRSLAGYSYGRADVVRRAISKKKPEVLERERASFIEGCAENGIDSGTATKIFNEISDFAGYAFNKSHAACYALVAYQCAYLKTYYPAQFMAALLTSVLDDSNKVARYITESKRLGLRLAPPDINTSMKGFTASENTINYGLLGIKNLGNDFIEEIIKERENGSFTDVFDFCRRMKSSGHFNRRAVESLIRCGALDSFKANRRQMLQGLPVMISNIEKMYEKAMYGQVGFFDISDDFDEGFDLPDVEEFPKSELLKMEKEMTGLYLSGHPMDKFDDYIVKAKCARTFELIEASKGEGKYKDRDNITLCGIITHITIKQTRAKKENMAFVSLEDLYGTIEIILFPQTYLKYSSLLSDGNVIAVSGTLSLEEEKDAKVLVNTVSVPDINNIPAENAPSAKTQSKRNGLYLKFESKDDPRLKKAQTITSIFEGTMPLYFYYEDEKKYVRQPSSAFVSVNNTMLSELKRLLGEKNVALIS